MSERLHEPNEIADLRSELDAAEGRIKRMKTRSTDQHHAEIGQWVVDTCLLYGASVATAHIVAAHFVRGLKGEDGDLCGR
jgi:hypothetical protein